MEILFFIFQLFLDALMIYLTLCFSYREHKLELKINGTRDLEKAHIDSFPSWFLQKAFNLRQQGALDMTDELFVLAMESMPTTLSFSTYVAN